MIELIKPGKIITIDFDKESVRLEKLRAKLEAQRTLGYLLSDCILSENSDYTNIFSNLKLWVTEQGKLEFKKLIRDFSRYKPTVDNIETLALSPDLPSLVMNLDTIKTESARLPHTFHQLASAVKEKYPGAFSDSSLSTILNLECYNLDDTCIGFKRPLKLSIKKSEYLYNKILDRVKINQTSGESQSIIEFVGGIDFFAPSSSVPSSDPWGLENDWSFKFFGAFPHPRNFQFCIIVDISGKGHISGNIWKITVTNSRYKELKFSEIGLSSEFAFYTGYDDDIRAVIRDAHSKFFKIDEPYQRDELQNQKNELQNQKNELQNQRDDLPTVKPKRRNRDWKKFTHYLSEFIAEKRKDSNGRPFPDPSVQRQKLVTSFLAWVLRKNTRLKSPKDPKDRKKLRDATEKELKKLLESGY